ncbi:serpin family protein [Streptomyces bohaiensis]|uniref:Serine protease n=1 Tax=Streptomyces bohaiensis TaxID=1431344 RepID=A0ABX1CCM6_9ACTN|nr:serpin family protein [Streptomyces bohaiensis]NJQ16861.1 serine protease [Streptomyces bohaiensis]
MDDGHHTRGAGPGAAAGPQGGPEAVTALAERWLPVVADSPGTTAAGGDFTVSPAGLWLATGMLAAGAAGATAAELRAVVGTAGEQAAPLLTEVRGALRATDAVVSAAGFWARAPLYRAFREEVPEVEFGPVDAGLAERLDAWMARATDGMIPRSPVRPQPGTAVLLADVLALTARWQDPFPPSATADAPFTDAAGGRTPVPVMWRTAPVADAWHVAERSATVVRLRCAGGPTAPGAEVRCVLGAPGAAAAEVLPAGWAPATARSGLDADLVRVGLPRLELTTTAELLPQLAALGARLLAGQGAEFPRLSPEPLFVDRAVQQCVLSLAESGVRAAAATVMSMRFGSAPPARPPRVETVLFDRPFGVVVLDGSGRLPMFTAWQATAPRSPAAAAAP